MMMAYACTMSIKYSNWVHFIKYIWELAVSDYQPWLISMNKCFKKGLLPISYQALTEIRPPRDPFWSGVISSDVIYNYTGIFEMCFNKYIFALLEYHL